MHKEEQTSDWGAKKLSLSQQKYAATDVFIYIELRIKLNEILKRRENRIKISRRVALIL